MSPAGSAPRRFLIATAVASHRHATQFDLPEMTHALDDIVDLFTTTLGYQRVTDLGLDPTRADLVTQLRGFCRADDRRPDDILAVYVGAHGDVLDGSHEYVLYTSDVDPQDLDDALPAVELGRKMLLGTGVRRVLLMLDTCYAGHGGGELTAAALTRMTTRWGVDPGSGLVVVTSAQPAQEAVPGAFPRLLRAAVESVSTSGYLGSTLRMDTVLDAMNRHPERPGHQTIGSTLAQLTGEVPAFLPNPGHDASAPRAGADRLDDDTYRYVAEDYLSWAVEAWSTIELNDLGREEDDADTGDRVRWLPLERMYISLQADPRSLVDRRRQDELRRRDRALLAPEAARRVSPREAIDQALAQGTRAGTGPAADGADGTSLEEAFDRHRVLVVLGHPGSGKSVMCQWLGHQIATTSRATLRRRTGEFPLPIRIRVADYARHWGERLAAGEGAPDVPGFLAANLPDDVAYPRPTLRAMFERALADGRAVLLLDGLDELTRYRTEVVDSLTRLVEEHVLREGDTMSRAVVTSRIAGYDDVYLSLDEAAHYLIRPMDDTQIEDFATRFFTEIRAPEQAPLLLRRLETGNRSVRRLARTPLLLTSMCSYWHRHSDLPASRAKLYRQLLLDTAYRWRKFTSEGEDTPLAALLSDESAFLTMLSRVAVRIHDEQVDGRLGEAALRETLEDALYGPALLTRPEARRTTAELMRRIRERVGVLAEVAPGEYAFIHQTFREYLAGVNLLAGSPTEEFADLAELVGDPAWREPVLLALGEGDPATRIQLMRWTVGEPSAELVQWAEILLSAALERPPAETTPTELTELLTLVAHSYEGVRDEPETVDDLDDAVAELRQHVGAAAFDPVAMGVVAADVSLAGAMAGVYWRQRWLTEAVLTTLAGLADHDAEVWGWPIQRALRAAAGPEPAWQVRILERLPDPAEGADIVDPDAVRLYEWGHAAWERRRKQADRARVEAVPPGLLPVRELLTARTDLWAECVADDDTLRVLVALFGGLDHQDAVRWDGEYHDFARVLQLADGSRTAEIQRRAAELVPRYGVDDVVYSMAVGLDTIRVTLGKPAPVLEPSWLTRPGTAEVRGAVLRWLSRTPRDADRLRGALRDVAATTQSAVERAEAEVGLLALDATPVTPGAAGSRAVARALESTSDAMLRGHGAWFQAVWSPFTELTDSERGVVHLALLKLLVGAAGRPVQPAIGDANVERHPVLAAERSARAVLADLWGEEPGGGYTGPTDSRAVVAWLSTLPYLDEAPRPPLPAVLWHTGMPRADVAAAAPFAATLRWLYSWAWRLNPWQSEETYRSLTAVFTRVGAPPPVEPGSSGGPVPPPPADVPAQLNRLYQHLRAQARSTATELHAVREVAASVPAPHTDLAYLAVGLAAHAAEAHRPTWHRLAFDLLATETDEAALAEALGRIRTHLPADPASLAPVTRLAARIGSPVLRAHAVGDLAAVAAELVARARPEPAHRVSLLVGARLVQEQARLSGRNSADEHPDGPPEPSSILGADGVEVLRARLADDPSDATGAAHALVAGVSRIEPEVAAPLGALVEAAPADARWARHGANLLRLQRVEQGESYAGFFHDLVEIVCTGDAATSALAYVKLGGPVRNASRDERALLLSRCGAAAWIELGRHATRTDDPLRRKLYRTALNELGIDDADAVREAVTSYTDGTVDTTTWCRLLQSSTLWEPDCQEIVAGWLGRVDDPVQAQAGLELAAILHTRGGSVGVEPSLRDAALAAATRTAVPARAVPGLSQSPWRTAVAEPVMQACRDALAAGLRAEAAVTTARSLFDERCVDVLGVDDDAEVRARLNAYGALVWHDLGSRPEDVRTYLGHEVDPAATIAVLAGWLWRADAPQPDTAATDPLTHAVVEALLSLLLVLGGRDPVAFRLACPPDVAQPVFGRRAVQGCAVCSAAALPLLSRLQYVDLHPASGPSLVDLLHTALRLDPLGRQAAHDFLRDVRHLRADSPAQALLDQIEATDNETVAQAFAGLAVGYLHSSGCSRQDRRRIRQALLQGANRNPRARAVSLGGTGGDRSPISPVSGPTRRAEFRRLFRLSQRDPAEVAGEPGTD